MSIVQQIERHGARVYAEDGSLILEGLDTLEEARAREILAFARQNKVLLLSELGESSGLHWPEPEPGTLEPHSTSWKYACLWAIVTTFGATLANDARDSLALICPDSMPQSAAQAARDGLAELTGYIQERIR